MSKAKENEAFKLAVRDAAERHVEARQVAQSLMPAAWQVLQDLMEPDQDPRLRLDAAKEAFARYYGKHMAGEIVAQMNKDGDEDPAAAVLKLARAASTMSEDEVRVIIESED